MSDTGKKISAEALNDFAAGAEKAMREQIAAGIPAALVLNALFGAVATIAIENDGIEHALAWLRAMTAAVERGAAEALRTTAN